ncbi:MAG: acylphosphatase, partial [Candidatus Kapabacteria bacterium]|nr:acylphosphatase [Candidatus Kapabacteria bacterium]
QGVGFRRYVLHHAQRLGLRGFVCNLDDGGVECVAQGDVDALTELETYIRTGPTFSAVADITCNDLQEDRVYHGFRIL